jgi:transposase
MEYDRASDYKNIFTMLIPFLNEQRRRLVTGAMAKVVGFGGISFVSAATGVSRRAIARGIEELDNPDAFDSDRIRKEGAGRKKTVDTDPTLIQDLESLIEPVARGDPESPLRWTCKSVRILSQELNQMGHQTSHRMVAELLHEMGYSLQSNQKTIEGCDHPDRDAQFEFINQQSKEFIANGQPVISVDTKKKELVGNFKNQGKELRPKGDPEQVMVYDFLTQAEGRVSPYGVYDIANNLGWVNVGTDYDTAEFAVESIRRWWNNMGHERYPDATSLLITADGGGSNGSRVRLWKVKLQEFADETGISVSVCHFPPGTSKWNKIEHRLFAFISQNWRGKPLISHEVIVSLIAATTTKKGLRVDCILDTNSYLKGIKITDAQMQSINIERNSFHGEWNYTIEPRAK